MAYKLFDRVTPYSTPGKAVTAPEHVGALMLDLEQAEQEHLYCLFLNVRSQLICKPHLISKGSNDGTDCNARDIYREAIRLNANSIILAHNHPSGDPSPSPADLSVTKRMAEAGSILGISLVDHCIIAAQGLYSLRRESPELFKA